MLRIIFAQFIICFLILQAAQALPEERYGFPEVNDKLEKLQIYFETEMYEEASVLLDEIITQFPNEPRFKYLQAIVDYQKGDYQRAQKVFLEFIENFPQTPEPYYLLSEINQRQGNLDLARQYLSKYCQLAPEDYAAYHKLKSTSEGPQAKEVIVIKDGKEDRDLVEKIDFYGYGACVHSPQKQSLRLINGGLRSRSSIELDFTYPVDLRGKRIALKMKGDKGGENFVLTFRDKFAPDYKPQLVVGPKIGTLSGEWQKLNIALENPGEQIDLSAIVHMGLEFGSAAAADSTSTILFVQDIIIADAAN